MRHNPAIPVTRCYLLRRWRGFIIRQIQAYPSISPCDLQKQLAAAFATQNQCNGAAEIEMPRVFADVEWQAQQVCWFPDPDRQWVLISGVVGGASGQVLGGSAAVFEIGPEQIRTIWSARAGIGNVKAFVPPGSLRWEIEYVDGKGTYSGTAHARLLDIYQLDDTNQSFRLLVHQPLD